VRTYEPIFLPLQQPHATLTSRNMQTPDRLHSRPLSISYIELLALQTLSIPNSRTHVLQRWRSRAGNSQLQLRPTGWRSSLTTVIPRIPNVLDNKEVFLYACALRQPPRAVRKPPWRTRAKKLPYYRVDSVHGTQTRRLKTQGYQPTG
jgi:hypothetical protein